MSRLSQRPAEFQRRPMLQRNPTLTRCGMCINGSDNCSIVSVAKKGFGRITPFRYASPRVMKSQCSHSHLIRVTQRNACSRGIQPPTLLPSLTRSPSVTLMGRWTVNQQFTPLIALLLCLHVPVHLQLRLSECIEFTISDASNRVILQFQSR